MSNDSWSPDLLANVVPKTLGEPEPRFTGLFRDSSRGAAATRRDDGGFSDRHDDSIDTRTETMAMQAKC